jgi:LL-diaminopimelate aminotransferase
MIQASKKLSQLPPYLFVSIDQAKRKARAEGRDIIDIGIGDPDLPTPQPIIEALYEAAKDPANHKYALDQGMSELREKISNWCKNRFSIELDPTCEIHPLIGSKEGIAHLPFALLNNGEYVLVPDPSYPPYRNCTILAGGKPFIMPLLEKNRFLPDLSKIPSKVFKKAKIIFINYPNNPTSAVATIEFYKDLVRFALKHKIVIASDLAYSELSFDGYLPPSILEIPKAKDIAIEFHSLSKTFNMTGWRLGWACGNKEIVAALGKFKTNIDSGVFQAIQIAGIAALNMDRSFIKENNKIYAQRREVIAKGLTSLGWEVFDTKATFYVWIKVPVKSSSIDFCKLLLEKCNIVATPGVGFGKYGEGYFRMALTVSQSRLEEAIRRISAIK